MIKFNNDWDDLLADEFVKPYYKNLRAKLKDEYANNIVYPHMNDIYKAFTLTSYNDVKVVILGQDPYHGEGQAHGLCFSVNEGIKVPPSLVNIFNELKTDVGFKDTQSGCLTKWAQRGVLLLNATLTVRQGQANSHSNIGWATFTDAVISILNQRQKPMVFLLWGNNAKLKAKAVTNPQHLLLTAPHPSPLSAHYGFFGCKHFSQANEFLLSTGQTPIDWQL